MLGLHVASVLAQEGQSVVSYSTSGRPPFAELVLGEYQALVKFVQGDILDFDHLRNTAEKWKVDGIIHAAAMTPEATARARPHQTICVNVAGTANVLEVARVRKVRRVVYVGSASEYGRRSDLQPIGEDEINVQGLYAETKHIGFRLSERYREFFGLSVLSVRVSSVYCPNTRFSELKRLVGNTLVAYLCRAAAFSETVTVRSGRDYPRDWTYARDAAKGICLAYNASSPRHNVYNIASGSHHAIAELIDTIREIEPNANVQLAVGAGLDDAAHERNLRGPLDISRARQDLGYAPSYTLAEGLREFIEWWRHVGPMREPPGMPQRRV